jgi:hypothetical protein
MLRFELRATELLRRGGQQDDPTSQSRLLLLKFLADWTTVG